MFSHILSYHWRFTGCSGFLSRIVDQIKFLASDDDACSGAAFPLPGAGKRAYSPRREAL
jgi:hypothetical protein